MVQGTTAEIAQLIEKTPLSRAGDGRQFGSKNGSKTTFLGDLDSHMISMSYWNSPEIPDVFPSRATVDATFVPWSWTSVKRRGERQLFPLSSLTFAVPRRYCVRQLCAVISSRLIRVFEFFGSCRRSAEGRTLVLWLSLLLLRK